MRRLQGARRLGRRVHISCTSWQSNRTCSMLNRAIWGSMAWWVLFIHKRQARLVRYVFCHFGTPDEQRAKRGPDDVECLDVLPTWSGSQCLEVMCRCPNSEFGAVMMNVVHRHTEISSALPLKPIQRRAFGTHSSDPSLENLSVTSV